MVNRSNERRILECKIQIGTRTGHVILPDMQKIMEVLDIYRKDSDAHYSMDGGRINYIIPDMKFDNRSACILFKMLDKEAANAVYGNFKHRTSRIIEKDVEESGERACHLLINMEEDEKGTRSYACFIEKVSGLSPSILMLILNRFLKEASKQDKSRFESVDTTGARRGGESIRKQFIPHVRIKGVISEQFAKDISDGTVRAIELSRNKVEKPIGSSAFISEEKMVLKAKVLKDGKSVTFDQIINFAKGGNKYKKLLINYETKDGLKKAAHYDMDSDDFVHSLNKHHDVTEITPPLNDSCKKIVPHFEEIMKKIMEKSNVL